MIVVDKDGEISEVEDYIEPPSTATIPVKNHIEITNQIKAQYQESRAEYAKRCRRNGKCPHDGKPCKHYRNCILKKAETCMNFATAKRGGQDMIACSVCVNRPATNRYWHCNMFNCMVAYKGRK